MSLIACWGASCQGERLPSVHRSNWGSSPLWGPFLSLAPSLPSSCISKSLLSPVALEAPFQTSPGLCTAFSVLVICRHPEGWMHRHCLVSPLGPSCLSKRLQGPDLHTGLILQGWSQKQTNKQTNKIKSYLFLLFSLIAKKGGTSQRRLGHAS